MNRRGLLGIPYSNPRKAVSHMSNRSLRRREKEWSRKICEDLNDGKSPKLNGKYKFNPRKLSETQVG